MSDTPIADENFEMRPCCVDGFADAQTTWLKVGNQSFPFGPAYHESKADAQWYVQMFRHALRQLLFEGEPSVCRSADATGQGKCRRWCGLNYCKTMVDDK